MNFSFIAAASRNSIGIDLIPYLVGHFISAAIMIAYWVWLRQGNIPVTFTFVILWALVFRLIGIWGEPILEDDYFRYILDSCNFVATGTPYGIVPSDLFVENSLPPECQPALTWMNNPHLPTIYAPVLQYFFALAYIVAPASVNAFQILMTGFDLLIVLLLCKLAPARNVLLYAWCPLILKEFAFTAHPDVIGAFFVLAALVMRKNNEKTAASVLIGIACCTKIFAILALPFVLLRYSPKYWLIALVTVALMYFPFVIQGATDLTVLGHFATNWQFNESFFRLIEYLTSDSVARYLCGFTFAVWFTVYLWKQIQHSSDTAIPRMDWVFGMLLFLSPVVNSWYLVWLLPFAVIRPSFWAWTAATVSVLSYVTGLHLSVEHLAAYEISATAWLTEYGCIGLALILDWYRHRLKQIVEH